MNEFIQSIALRDYLFLGAGFLLFALLLFIKEFYMQNEFIVNWLMIIGIISGVLFLFRWELHEGFNDFKAMSSNDSGQQIADITCFHDVNNNVNVDECL